MEGKFAWNPGCKGELLQAEFAEEWFDGSKHRRLEPCVEAAADFAQVKPNWNTIHPTEDLQQGMVGAIL